MGIHRGLCGGLCGYVEVYMGLHRGLCGSRQVYVQVFVGLCGPT